MLNRQALEDAVYDSYRDMDMSSIQRMPDAKLQWLLDEKRTKRGRQRNKEGGGQGQVVARKALRVSVGQEQAPCGDKGEMRRQGSGPRLR